MLEIRFNVLNKEEFEALQNLIEYDFSVNNGINVIPLTIIDILKTAGVESDIEIYKKKEVAVINGAFYVKRGIKLDIPILTGIDIKNDTISILLDYSRIANKAGINLVVVNLNMIYD